MTVPAVAGERVRIRCAAAASAALQPILCGDPAPGEILGRSGHAVWIATRHDVVVVAASDAVRLPNGVALPVPSRRDPLGTPGSAAGCTVGGGRLLLPGADVQVVRWWDPRPALPAAAPGSVLERVAWLRARVEVPLDRGLGRALAAGDAGGALEAVLGLLGRGDGLTPAGDDLAAGALASYLLIGGALGNPASGPVVARVAGPLDAAARERTTSLSAALLRHACRGAVADPAAGLLRSLAGRGDPETACDALCAVGHSSGPALAAGVLIGAAAAAGREVP